MAIILIGDIGGTNSRLRLQHSDTNEVVKADTLHSHSFPSFEALLRAFLGDVKPTVAIFAVAGIALGTHARFVNQNWDPVEVVAANIEFDLGIAKVVFLNDFEAAGYGVLALGDDDLININEGSVPAENGRKVVMGPSTSLGEALLTWTGSKYQSWPGEGGHSDFAPHNDEQWEYAKYMMNLVQTSDEYERFRPCEAVSFEVCCAGVGAYHIYEFYRKRFPELADPAFDELWAAHPDDRTKNMLEYGFAKKNELCKRSVELWLKILAYEAGNLIAKNLPLGGLYLIGGLVSRNQKNFLEWREVFLWALKTKPKHVNDIIDRTPVYVTNHEDVAMEGVILYAKNVVKELIHN